MHLQNIKEINNLKASEKYPLTQSRPINSQCIYYIPKILVKFILPFCIHTEKLRNSYNREQKSVPYKNQLSKNL